MKELKRRELRCPACGRQYVYTVPDEGKALVCAMHPTVELVELEDG